MSILSSFTAYMKQVWENRPSILTAISAARLGHMEDGIKMTSDAIEEIAAAVVSTIVNDPDKIASMAALYAVNEAVNQLNSDMKNYLPLTGGTLTGDLYFGSGHGRITNTANVFQYEVRDIAGDASNRRLFILNSKTSKSDVKNAVMLNDINDGTAKGYYMFGQHNKPSGSYTGNGSTAKRTISMDGIGHALLVWGNGYSNIITPQGGIGFAYDDTDPIKTPYAECFFENRTLTLETAADHLNKSGATYYYESL